MAQVDTANNPNDPNNPNNQPQQNQQANQQINQPATTGGAGAVTTTGAGNVTGQVTGTNTPTQPFQNIASYLAANAPQSQALAGQVASSVANPIAQTQQDIQNASQNFEQSVNAGYTPENQQTISSVASNPVQAAATPQSVAAFQQQLNDAYTGPTDFTATPNYSNLESEIANAQALGTAAQTPTGIQTLLQGIEGPTATAGINNLDTLLLAQNPTNFATISGAGAPATTANNALGTDLTNAATSSNAAAQSGSAAAEQAAKDAAAALASSASGVAGDVNAAYNSALSGTEAYNTELSNILNTIATGNVANLTPSQQTEVGYNPTDATALQIYNEIFPAVAQANEPNLASYYSGPQSAFLPTSAAQVETPQQAAAIAALQTLNGGNLPSTLAGLTGTAPATPYSVPTNFGQYNNAQLLSYLYSTMYPAWAEYNSVPADAGTQENTINALMAQLAAYANAPQPVPPPQTPPSPPLAPPTTTGGSGSAGGGAGRAFA